MTTQILNDARKRLLDDLSEVSDANLDHVAVMPLSGDNLFVWHINLVPQKGALEGHIFHLTMTFEQTYPEAPPQVAIMAPLKGDEVVRLLGKLILGLDVLNREKGWSPSQTSLEVLQKIDEFLCNYTGTPDHVEEVIEATQTYKCKLTDHTYSNPVPWPKCIAKPSTPETGNQTYVNNPSNEWQVAKATSGVGWGKVMYEARLDKVERITNQYQPNTFADSTSNMCSCRFGWATADSEEGALSGIFYGNGESSHIIIRAKTKIATFLELGEKETFHEGDFICAGVDFEENVAWFARNGEKVGKAKGYPLPPFLRKQMLYPVVGLQNSAVQLNFGIPKSNVPDTEGWMTIDQHKQITKTDYLWNTRRQLHGGWNQLFVNDFPRGTVGNQNLAANIFSFLKDSDLLKCKYVCSDWRRLISDSYLLQRSKLRCSILKLPFRNCELGIGMIISYSEDGVHINSVRSQVEYFSWNAWNTRNVRVGPAGVEYTHFFPLAIDNDHARTAVPILQSIFQTFLPGQNLTWSPAGVLTVMTSLLNGAIVALANDAAEPTKDEALKQLQLYTHLHHMFLYLNKHFQRQITSIARAEIQSTLESDSRLEKDHLYDIGTFMLSIAITPDYQWKNIRKPVLLELFDRDVPKYLQRFPELEFNQEDPGLQLRKVMDCIVYERRKTMLQTWFTVNVNFHGPSPMNILKETLEGYNRRFGSATKAITEEIHQSINKIYEADDWGSYFTGLYLKPKSQEFMKNLLVESMRRALEKRYYTPRETIEPTPMQDPYPPQSTQQPYYPPQQAQRVPQQGPRICHKFQDLSPPLAVCLEDCEPLPLQAEALPIITRGTESVIISPLGTGKHTLAAITVVNTLIQSKKGSQVLVLVPEKNQAVHFEEILSDIYVHVPDSDMHPHLKIPINVILSVAKEPYPSRQQLEQRCVMVGTPGRVSDLIEKKYIDPSLLKAVYILEGDSLLANVGTRNRTFECFKHIFSGIQLVFMAATYTPFVAEAYGCLGDPNAPENGILNKTSTEDRFTHFFVGCIYEVKKMPIFELLCREMTFEQGIAYCANTDKVRKFHNEVNAISGSDQVGMLHKGMDPEERREQVRNFNDKTTRILIIEDRIPLYGLKTQSVSCVIHVDVPRPPRPRQDDAIQFQKQDSALDAYERRLSNVLQGEQQITSISFSYRDRGTEAFLQVLKDTHGIEELPEDPNTI